ncbi:hypothetical protein B932_3731 (plasmid) [Gluconobacter oxydans H24]|nr:hypothetical protein B932_3731 [Gluconobacter oxydans H24]
MGAQPTGTHPANEGPVPVLADVLAAAPERLELVDNRLKREHREWQLSITPYQ